jgi:hypothetical protein
MASTLSLCMVDELGLTALGLTALGLTALGLTALGLAGRSGPPWAAAVRVKLEGGGGSGTGLRSVWRSPTS